MPCTRAGWVKLSSSKHVSNPTPRICSMVPMAPSASIGLPRASQDSSCSLTSMQDSFGARHFAPHPESLNKLEIDSTEGEGRSPWRVTPPPPPPPPGRGGGG